MLAILSLDFDYFIDASAEQRDRYFLRGGEEIPRRRLGSLWAERYAAYPQLRGIGVVEQFGLVKQFLGALNVERSKVFLSETHRAIKCVIDAIPVEVPLRIVNIDFHHDYYHYYSGGDVCNCGNWLRRVMEERPGTQVKWIRREDSQIATLEGDFPFEHTTDLGCVFQERFACVFMCRSPEWSPPHLSGFYEELACALLKKSPQALASPGARTAGG